MNLLSRIGLILLIIGCQGVVSGFAGTGEAKTGKLQSENASVSQEAAPGSHYLNVEGTLKEIQGDVYVLEGSSTTKAFRVHVGGDTAFPNGQKEPGQTVQALVIASTGHALIIR